jgi:hypothetical protein
VLARRGERAEPTWRLVGRSPTNPGVPELMLDLETLWRLDVLEIDRTEGRLKRCDGIDKPIRVRGDDFDIETSIPADFLKRTALPSITVFEASGPMLPRPRTTLPLVTTPTRFARAVSRAAAALSLTIFVAGEGDARRIGKRKITLRRERLCRCDGEFARGIGLMIVVGAFPELVRHSAPSPGLFC